MGQLLALPDLSGDDRRVVLRARTELADLRRRGVPCSSSPCSEREILRMGAGLFSKAQAAGLERGQALSAAARALAVQLAQLGDARRTGT